MVEAHEKTPYMEELHSENPLVTDLAKQFEDHFAECDEYHTIEPLLKKVLNGDIIVTNAEIPTNSKKAYGEKLA
jgi:hypothetical protein